MGKMSEINIMITEYLNSNFTPEQIAQKLNIPVNWVYDSYPVTSEEEEYFHNMESNVGPPVL